MMGPVPGHLGSCSRFPGDVLGSWQRGQEKGSALRPPKDPFELA